jgi:hypothetical protein
VDIYGRKFTHAVEKGFGKIKRELKCTRELLREFVQVAVVACHDGSEHRVVFRPRVRRGASDRREMEVLIWICLIRSDEKRFLHVSTTLGVKFRLKKWLESPVVLSFMDVGTQS